MQTIVQKLLEQIDDIINPIPLYEMSSGWFDKKENRCAWVENPGNPNNQYFKYGNDIGINKATKVARISLLEPKYLYHRDKAYIWALTNKEINNLINILKSPSDKHKGLTKWQDLLITYNEDNFYILPEDTINNNINYKECPKAFNINTKMPDYTKLVFDKNKAGRVNHGRISN